MPLTRFNALKDLDSNPDLYSDSVPKSAFNVLELESNLVFKARLWKLYYEIRLPLKNHAESDKIYTHAQLFNEYYALYNEFHNSICSLNTTILFYYCTLTICPLFSAALPDVRLDSILNEICHTIIDQADISEEDNDLLLNSIHRMTDTLAKLKST